MREKPRAPRPPARVIASLCAIGAVAGLAVASAGAVSNGRDCAEVSNDPSRFGTFGSARLCWWEEAWDVFAGHSLQGAGAGTFEIARKRYRSDARSVVEPHSVPLQHLSDGGVAGLALFVALIGAAAAVHRRASPTRRPGTCGRRRARDPAGRLPRACARRLQLELPRGNGADDGGARRPRGAGRAPGSSRRRPLLAVAAVIAAVTVFVSFSFPQLADRMERSSARRRRERPRARARSRAVGSLLQARWNPSSRFPGWTRRAAGRSRRSAATSRRSSSAEGPGRGTRPGSSSSRHVRTSALRTAT